MRKSSFLLAALMLFSAFAFSQVSKISGQITNEKGEPVSFATIRIKGTNTAVSADQSGNYSIDAAKGAVLVVSAASFQSSEVTVGTSANLGISLKPQSSLQEVVVTALGVSRSKEKLGYSSTNFRSEDITRTAPISPLDALQGKVAGADLSNVSGQPGGSSKIILRGYSSLGQSNQALIVIDGVPMNNARPGSGSRGQEGLLNAQGGSDYGNGLNDLNPNDIESISILKGASASSLYGSRAQNGAVMITTKKGRAGQMRIDFNSSVVLSSVGKLPDFQNVWGQGWSGLHYKEENGSWGPKMDGVDRLWGSTVDNSRLIKPFSPVEDNIKDFYDQGLEVNNSLAIRGGNENANYYFSYGNVYTNGIIPTDADSYKRNTFALRGSLKANEKFTINSSFNYINKNSKTVSTDDDPAGSSTFENILQMGRDIPITDFKDYKNKFFNVDNYFTPYAANPYFSLNENGNVYTSDRFFGNIDLNYKFSNALNLQWRTGGDFTNARLKDWQAIEAPKTGSWRGPNPTNAEGASYTATTGGLTERSDYAGEINSDVFLNYNHEIVNDLNFSGFLGANFNQREARAQRTRITQLTIPGFYNLTNTSSTPIARATTSRRRLFGTFAQANFEYKGLLYLQLNARNDWSSTLPADKRSFFYPGANLSLVISKLTDLSSAKIDYLKVRGAFGKTGSDAPLYSLFSTLTAADILLGFGNLIFPLNGISAFEVGNIIGNNSLKPEITTETEVGVEARLFNNRVGFDVSLYQKVSDGQIYNIAIAPTSGYTSLTANFGKLRNRGIEVSANVSPIKTRDFSWDINYTYTKNRNTVLDLPVGLEKIDFSTYYDVKMVARSGQPMGMVEAPGMQMTADGRPIVNAATGFFATTNEDVPYGTVQKDFIMGLNNSFTYKNWRLGFTLDYRKGGVMISRTADLTYFTGNAWATQYNDRRPFIIPNSVIQTGTDAAGKPVYAENTTPVDMTNYNAYWYHTDDKGFSYSSLILPKSFMKLRDVTLTYTLPAAWASKIKAQGISLSAVARNFMLWTPTKNVFVDPEVSDINNDFLGEFGELAAAPAVKSYGLSLRIGF